MEAVKEITDWGTAAAKNNTYLLDGTNLVAYIKHGETQPFYFTNPIKGFDRKGRKFETVSLDLFPNRTTKSRIIANAMIKVDDFFNGRKVKGSKGEIYTVNDREGTCTCPGYTYRGACKHLEQAQPA